MTRETRTAPDSRFEDGFRAQGYRYIAGVDEVGRGPLAGPVMAGAVIFPAGLSESWTSGIRDSKQLTLLVREHLSARIYQIALAIGIGRASIEEIDSLGIVPATRLAMTRAIDNLDTAPDALVIDALPLPKIALPQKYPIRGDSISLSIAAASIVAKVARDSLMIKSDRTYPGYGFCRNKGYGTREHIGALMRLGPCPLHRRTFAPVSALVANLETNVGPYEYK